MILQPNVKNATVFSGNSVQTFSKGQFFILENTFFHTFTVKIKPMAILHAPINFRKWIDEHRHLLKPPVGNQVVWTDTDFIIMVVGGPNSRKDYHFNETPEFFYQLEGDMILKIIDPEKGPRDIPIKEGEIFHLPPCIPHSPQRVADTVGLVVEIKRPEGVLDGFQWYCESCGEKIYDVRIPLIDIVKDLPEIFEAFYGNEQNRKCDHCGTVLQPPKKIKK